MNAERRKRIGKVWDVIEDLKNELEYIKEEEDEALDNLPESLQYGERGERMQSAIDNLDYAISSIEDVISYLQDAME